MTQLTFPAAFMPNIDRLHLISRMQDVNHGPNGRYRVVLYGAYDACGPLDHTRNGIAILFKPNDGARWATVVYELAQEVTGYHGPSAAQVQLYEEIVAMPWKGFRALVNRNKHKHFKI